MIMDRNDIFPNLDSFKSIENVWSSKYSIKTLANRVKITSHGLFYFTSLDVVYKG
jgi:hypothetical protein